MDREHNAIHGLLRWRQWRAVRHEPDRVVMAARLHPSKGYPFLLDIEVGYSLSEAGLRVQTTATNTGVIACPYGCGQHPYLCAGDGLIDDCTLQLDAATRILTDERQLPIGAEQVDGTAYDFRAGKLVGDLKVDHAYTDLARDVDGRAWARLLRPDGTTAEMWVDRTYPIIESDHRDLHRRHAESHTASPWVRHRADELSAECVADAARSDHPRTRRIGHDVVGRPAELGPIRPGFIQHRHSSRPAAHGGQ